MRRSVHLETGALAVGAPGDVGVDGTPDVGSTPMTDPASSLAGPPPRAITWDFARSYCSSDSSPLRCSAASACSSSVSPIRRSVCG